MILAICAILVCAGTDRAQTLRARVSVIPGSSAAFKIEGQQHSDEREALSFAAKNPLDAAHMVLVLAGNDALRTVKLAQSSGRGESVPFVVSGEAKR